MKHIHTLITLFICICSSLSCDKAEAQTDSRNYPLSALAVRSGGSWYHAAIDQDTRVATIGAVEYLNSITDVNYTIASGATISPDPKSSDWKWSESQYFTVTSDGAETVYKVEFTALRPADEQGLIFADEFDIDGTPDQSKWSLCPKGNPDWCNQMSESYDQAYVKDGNLVLVGEKKNGQYLAGGIQSKDKFSFSFGRVECRAKLTRHPDGAFPAIWMMPQTPLYEGWPACGEIDIMEHVRQEPHIHQTIHTHYRNNLGFDENTTAQTPCNYADWVVYAVDWTPDKLTFYVDGKETFSYSNMNLPDEAEKKQWPYGPGSAYYLILNMGLGDEGTWAGPMDDANLPAIMEIDWIRVYQQ
ncbi:MAG: glycosyl hydrolase family protein [Bacteroidales bacterium]|nr:glycosyl hydrolase family protein [Bacteroidales bacterium]